ncbi:SRPBCC family protein [Actinomycetospora cinnamomea]|uniref:Polyketide cyclase/dehydrase/lipid transport protein n=1 Tax=Actinomycetospora cinnamomea TaxID=663609 RepID=A0A2U1F477_9PSEU|nr:SRPBCC family protein [Actinomycetospora cinnamomea]PVZ06830.1 polyketide cyclase/dehydrase/lipid transport protein [Actinomycetospora cinnamomea]
MEWTRSIVVDRRLPQVQEAVADEHRLVEWSAWPDATGYRCAIDGDGRSLGSAIVFRDGAGAEKGRQRLAAVEPGRVSYRLRNEGPGGRVMTPEVDFRLEPVDGTRTRVHLDFRATAPLPPGVRQLVERLMGRRIRRLHDEDLERLKAHVEQAPARRD